MCGILFEIRNSGRTIMEDEQILQRIKNRGPDCINSTELVINDVTSLYFCGSVLWMQGLNPTEQPVIKEQGILLFNGDIFDRTWDTKISDTEFIMEKLSKSQTAEQIISEIKMFKGPFSLIYYDKVSHHLFFSRDRIGRNSLLFHRKYPCIEVPATYIYELSINENRINLYTWDKDTNICKTYSVEEWTQNVQKQQLLSDDEFVINFDTLDLNDEDNVIEQIENVSKKHNDKLTIMKNLLENTVILNTVTKIAELLEKSVKVRLEIQPKKCKDCIKKETTLCCHCTTGILFSGGLDCTILAILANKYVPKNQPIDLINVAFTTKTNSSYEVPDRITGRQSFEELKNICKLRQWVFHEVNIPREKLEYYQALTIGDLVYPRRTILDESLGTALWFAAGGGLEKNNDVSTCRILLLGSGADELFGGYTRHRNAFKRRGWLGLSKELILDWKRISFRNLARDNRVICDHGRQPRMPYLDEDLVDYVLKLKPWLKCFPSASLECGIGDKLILRLTALHIGLTEVVTLPKRALQFGSRIANSKQKGSDVSSTFIDI
ncbi:asparagine synthetase domain-containing protein CG17486 isoform X2 [Pararge aegeria]|uniref:asparagine synthetase domain-containing protein CG17486 isoform X2 n=1 Tax=Pararge aegeria TaxID=116150 RepID=UPI0019D1C448|nr:asparagine synthetase domain-containing protein CG17486 isoform X2 [Pararge aegeria]